MGPFYWNIDANAVAGGNVLFRVPVSFTTLPTDRYAWTLNLIYKRGGSSHTANPAPGGEVSYVDRSSSEFGKGWYHGDLAKLKIKSNGFLLVTGDGEPTWFSWNGSAYVRETGDQSFYTVTGNQTSTYLTLTDKFGTSLTFLRNAPSGWGRLESIFDASGNERRFTYDTNHVLQTIQYIPTEDKNDFTYVNGVITKIKETIGTTNPKYREVILTTSSGQLTALTLPDPDGPSNPLTSPVWNYAYNSTSGLLTKTTDPLGNITGITYGTNVLECRDCCLDHARRRHLDACALYHTGCRQHQFDPARHAKARHRFLRPIYR